MTYTRQSPHDTSDLFHSAGVITFLLEWSFMAAKVGSFSKGRLFFDLLPLALISKLFRPGLGTDDNTNRIIGRHFGVDDFIQYR